MPGLQRASIFWGGWGVSGVRHRVGVAHEFLPEQGLWRCIPGAQTWSLARLHKVRDCSSIGEVPAVEALQKRRVEIEKQLKEVTAHPKARGPSERLVWQPSAPGGRLPWEVKEELEWFESLSLRTGAVENEKEECPQKNTRCWRAGWAEMKGHGTPEWRGQLVPAMLPGDGVEVGDQPGPLVSQPTQNTREGWPPHAADRACS